jgi:CRP/FNR family transcriptional regulator, cyclic AMP receptor protein
LPAREFLRDTPAPAAALREVLVHGAWFRALPATLQSWLLDTAVQRNLTANERLFSRGDPPCGLYAVARGAIRVTGVSADGKEALLTLMEPPHWFGEISLFDGLPRTHDAVADVASLVLQVPQPALNGLLEQQPQLWRTFGLLLAHKVRLAFVAMEDTALLPAATRLARRLLLIAGDYAGGFPGGEAGNAAPPAGRRVIAVRQEQLAMMLSLSRQTTNQILRDLEERGIARLTRGEIEIVDFGLLRAAASL